jgi:hypothetical protein
MLRAAILVSLLCSPGVLGCGQTIYATLQETQRQRCMSETSGERERCLAAADTSYDAYQRQR